MKKHIINRHDPKPVLFKCPLCEQRCKQKYNLKAHMINKHDTVYKDDMFWSGK
jgi:hypothetical protein